MTTHRDVLRLLARLDGDEKHEPSAYSTLDVLWTLYERVLGPDDRFLLSKGHGPQAYYAVLAARGLLDPALLDTFGSFSSPLGHHPDRVLAPGVELSSGSLGHGLPIGVGLALGLRARGRPGRVVVLLGDAELDEGSNHEAIAYAGRIGLGRLAVVAIDNRSATHGWPGGIGARFGLEGWSHLECDGRDHAAIDAAFGSWSSDRPHCVVATVEVSDA